MKLCGANDDSRGGIPFLDPWKALACAREQLDSLRDYKEICSNKEDLRDGGLRHKTDILDPALATQGGLDSEKEHLH